MDVVVFCRSCGFTGDMLIIESEADCMEWSPRSVHVPKGKKVTVYDTCQFAGEDATFTPGDVECIDEIDFDLLAANGITLSGKKNLKTNSKKSDLVTFKVMDY